MTEQALLDTWNEVLSDLGYLDRGEPIAGADSEALKLCIIEYGKRLTK